MIAVAVHGMYLRIAAPYSDLEKARGLKGRRWHRDLQRWIVPATPECAREVKEVWPDVQGDEGFEELLRKARAAYAARDNRHRIDLPPLPGELPTDPDPSWIHQRQAFWFGADQTSVGLAIGMGGGKSRIAVELCDHWGAEKVLIVTTPNGLGVWPRQFRDWSRRDWSVINHGGITRRGTPRADPSTLQRIAAAQEALDRPGPTVVVVHYQALPHMRHWILGQRWDVGLLDESHNAKATGGVWSKLVEALMRRCDHRLCLTGTPMPNNKLDVFSQTRFLDPGIFGTNFALHRATYAIMGGYIGPKGPTKIVGYQNEADFEQRMARVWYVASEDDMDLGLPPTHEVTRTFDLGARARAAYDGLKDTAVTWAAGSITTTPHTLTKLLRLAQITGGYLPADDGTVAKIDDGKGKLLGEVLDGIREKTVVVARFTADLDTIRDVTEGLGLRYGEVSGRQSDLTADATFPDDVDVLGVQIQAGSEAIDLTASRYCILYSIGFDNGKYQQVRKRTHRPGQTRATTYIHLVARATIDVVERRALDNKQDAADAVLAAVRAEVGA